MDACSHSVERSPHSLANQGGQVGHRINSVSFFSQQPLTAFYAMLWAIVLMSALPVSMAVLPALRAPLCRASN